MADNNVRIVIPNDVEVVKEEAAKSNVVQGGDSKCVEKPPAGTGTSETTLRCTVCVPPNCPPGYQLGIDGKCHEIID